MKALIKKTFSIFGLGVYRLNHQTGDHQMPPKCVVSSPLEHNSKEGLNAFYSDQQTAESYLDLEFYGRVVDFLSEKGTSYDDQHIADIGCGAGHLLKFIQDRYRPASINGFEYSEAALEIARARLPQAKMNYLDIYEPPTLKFDVLFCIEVLEHLLYPDKALRNINAMIAPGGTAILTVPNGRTDTFDGHINFWSPESWDIFVRAICSEAKVETGLIEDGTTNFAIVRSSES